MIDDAALWRPASNGKITYDESRDDPPETWPFAEMFDLEQEGEGVKLLAAGKDEESQ